MKRSLRASLLFSFSNCVRNSERSEVRREKYILFYGEIQTLKY